MLGGGREGKGRGLTGWHVFGTGGDSGKEGYGSFATLRACNTRHKSCEAVWSTCYRMEEGI